MHPRLSQVLEKSLVATSILLLALGVGPRPGG